MHDINIDKIDKFIEGISKSDLRNSLKNLCFDDSQFNQEEADLIISKHKLTHIKLCFEDEEDY